MDEIEALLLAQESMLEKKCQVQILDTSKPDTSNTVTVNMAQTKNGGRNSNGNFQNNRGRGQRFFTRGGRRGGRPNFQNFYPTPQGTQRPQQSQQYQTTCQLCGKPGCYYLFDYNFQPYQQHTPTSNTQRPQGQISAMMASYDPSYDPSWYTDSGASNHLTPDAQNLMTKSEYNGQEMVYVGNDTGLTINSFGQSFLKDSQSNSLILQNLLHVPNIAKNLLSVSKFYQDNVVFFEFHSNKCYVFKENTFGREG